MIEDKAMSAQQIQTISGDISFDLCHCSTRRCDNNDVVGCEIVTAS